MRVPFPDGRGRLEQFYGSIVAMFTHQAWPSGPELCVLEVDWYTNHGRAAVSGNALVGAPENRGHTNDRSVKFVRTRIVYTCILILYDV